MRATNPASGLEVGTTGSWPVASRASGAATGAGTGSSSSPTGSAAATCSTVSGVDSGFRLRRLLDELRDRRGFAGEDVVVTIGWQYHAPKRTSFRRPQPVGGRSLSGGTVPPGHAVVRNLPHTPAHHRPRAPAPAASALLCITPPMPPGPHSTRDLPVFNRWICMTRIRAAVMVTLFVALVNVLAPGVILAPPVFGVCTVLVLSAVTSLALPRSAQATLAFFQAQSLVDIAGITVGIATSVQGNIGLLMHSIYALVVIPASLLSVSAGVIALVGSTLGHGILIGLERGFDARLLVSVEFLVPAFLFLLVTQQAFFYGGHLGEKNQALATLS